jgi:hypothetical protein
MIDSMSGRYHILILFTRYIRSRKSHLIVDAQRKTRLFDEHTRLLQARIHGLIREVQALSINGMCGLQRMAGEA